VIRDAVIGDVDALVNLGTSFLAQTPYGALLPTQPAAIAGIMTRLIESPDGVLFVSVDRAGTLTGMLGALCFVHPLSGEWVASEFYWWVEPAARGGLDSLRLLKLTITWARAQGAVRLHMIAPEGSGVGRLYRRLGFVPVETAYQKNLTTDDDVFTRSDHAHRSASETTQRPSGLSGRPHESPEPATRGLPVRSTGIVAAREILFSERQGLSS